MSAGRSEVEIFSDGACRGNPGPGGWGAILRYGDVEKEISGFEARTTNNRMELKAVIEALRALKRPCRVTVFTDSQYVQKGMSEWLPKWRKADFKLKDGTDRPNTDLWRCLDELTSKHRVRWQWVRGHAGHPENERADALARNAIEG